MKLGHTAPRIGDLHLLTSALKSSHRAPKESDSDPQSCPCCSCSYRNYAFGYRCNKIKWISLKDGFLTALKQWGTGLKNIHLRFIWRSGLAIVYFCMLIYNCVKLGIGIRKSLGGGFIMFVVLSAIFSIIGFSISLTRVLVFFIRRRKTFFITWCTCLCLCISVLCMVCKCMFRCCTKKKEDDESGKDKGSAERNQGESKSGEEEDSQKREESRRGEEEDSQKREESRRGEDKDSAKTKEKEDTAEKPTDDHSTRIYSCSIYDEWQSPMMQLKTSKGGQLIMGNILDSVLTISDKIIGTVTFIFTLYAFFGNERFNFHLFTHGDRAEFFFAYFLPAAVIIFSHISWIHGIRVNVKNLDKDIDSIPDEGIKRSQSEKIFSFQHGIIFHAVASGLLQVWFLVVLSWKIIRDHCLSQSEALELGILTNNTGVYVGPLARCYVPDLRPNTINYFTVINIIYIVIIFPILSYLILFISNLPLFVEYTQRLHTSGLYKVEKMLDEASPGGELGMESGIHKFFSIFFEIIEAKFDKAFLLTKKKEIAELRKAVQKDMLGYYKKSSRKLESTIFSLPTIALGVIHVGLFLMNIGFLSCRYSLATNSLECSSSFDSFGAFTGSLLGDEALLITPLLILFFLTGFPGPVITMLLIFGFIGVLMLIGSVIFLFVLAVVLIFILGGIGNSNTRTTRY